MGSKNDIQLRTEYEGSMKETAANHRRLTLILKKLPSNPTRPSCGLCSKAFSTDKALFGHMRCHPDRTRRGFAPPPAPSASLVSPKFGSSSDFDDNHRPSSSMSGTESLDSGDLYMSLPRWSMKGKRGGKGAVLSQSPLSSVPAATSEAVVIDPVLESVRGLLMLAANFDPKSPAAVLGDGGGSLAPRLKKHKTVEAAEELGLKYRCEVCNKRFARSQSLGTHRRTHSLGGWGTNKDDDTGVKYASDACCGGKGELMISEDESHDHQMAESGETRLKVLPFDLNELPLFEDYGSQFCTTS